MLWVWVWVCFFLPFFLFLLAFLLPGKISTARSAEFLLPRQLSELVLGGMELGAADDAVRLCYRLEHVPMEAALSRQAVLACSRVLM